MSASATFDDVLAAARRLEGVAIRTPLLENARVNARLGGRLFIKAECLQRTGLDEEAPAQPGVDAGVLEQRRAEGNALEAAGSG